MNKLFLLFSVILTSQLGLASQNVECTLSVKKASSNVVLKQKLNEGNSLILGKVAVAQIKSADVVYMATVMPSFLELKEDGSLFVSYVELITQNVKTGSQSTTKGNIIITAPNSSAELSTQKVSSNGLSEGLAVTCTTK